MTPQAALATSATHIDDAVEFLTFPRHDWAFEALWRGVAHLIEAADPRGSDPATAPIAVGSLRALASGRRLPATLSAVVHDIEAVVGALDAMDVAGSSHDNAGAIAKATLAASEAISDVARVAGLVDPGESYAALSGAWTPPPAPRVPRSRVARRDALRLLGVGAIGSVAACTPSRVEPVATPAEPAPEARQTAARSVPPATAAAVTPLTAMQWPTDDPFLFCAHHVDHYPRGNAAQGPDASLSGRQLGRDFDPARDWRMYHGETVPGFPRHPHRGFETVTVVRTGLLDHADSMGATARYGGGDVQWLTAGGGIQHAEMFPLTRNDRDNPVELFQIWLNLPRANKMVEPHFSMLWADTIPHVQPSVAASAGVEVTLIAGRLGEVSAPPPPPNSWAADPANDVAIWTLKLDAGARFELPEVAVGTQRSLYLHVGNGGHVAGVDVPNLSRVQLSGSGTAELRAGDAPTEVLLLQGRPIGEPVARRGPFVMNSQDEIRQAYADYQRTRFGGWPWGDDGPVHPATRGRFAERPGQGSEEPS